MIWLIFLIIFSKQPISSTGNNLIVQLPEGKIQGHVLQSFKGMNYYAFQEVPYAEPPVGSNRFQPAKDLKPWKGILNATKNTKTCIQIRGKYTSDIVQVEDCLYLNIYTPKKPGTKNLLPVLFWIHEGAFRKGSGIFEDAEPKYWMDYGIIIVTINFRLGPLGFLTTMDGVIPGNLGLKDQRKALEWVKSRIHLFGGDHEKITIAGLSSGAMSVSYLLLDKSTRGLYRGAIQESGSSLCRKSFSNFARNYAFQVGQQLNENFNQNSSSEDLLELLQKVPVEDIFISANKISTVPDYSIGVTADITWGVVLESEKEKTPVITEPMLESFLKNNYNQVPTMLGINSEEALLFRPSINISTQEIIQRELDEEPAAIIGPKLKVPERFLPEMSKEIRKLYTNSNFSNDVSAFIRLSTDATYSNAVIKQAQVMSSHVPVYLYQFSYLGESGLTNYYKGVRPVIPGAEGVGHGEELQYMWVNSRNRHQVQNSEDRNMSERLLKLWSNFIKYQNPTPFPDESWDNVTWPRLDSNNFQYLNINQSFTIGKQLRDFQKVDEIFNKYLQSPYFVY